MAYSPTTRWFVLQEGVPGEIAFCPWAAAVLYSCMLGPFQGSFLTTENWAQSSTQIGPVISPVVIFGTAYPWCNCAPAVRHSQLSYCAVFEPEDTIFRNRTRGWQVRGSLALPCTLRQPASLFFLCLMQYSISTSDKCEWQWFFPTKDSVSSFLSITEKVFLALKFDSLFKNCNFGPHVF